MPEVDDPKTLGQTGTQTQPYQISGETEVLPDSLPFSFGYRVLVDPEGHRRFTYLSPGLARAHGVTPEQVYADPLLLYTQIHEEDLSRILDAEAYALDTETPLRVELRFVKPTGETRWALLHSIPKRRPDGWIIWDGVEIDITERRSTEEALREGEEKYRRLVEASPHPMFLRDADDTITYMNPAGLRTLGAANPDEVIGKPSLTLVHPDYHPVILARIDRVLQKGETTPLLEEKFLRLDGSTVEVEVTSAPFSQNGRPCMQVLFSDITKRKQSEEAIRESEAFLDTIIEHSPYAMWVSDSSGTMIRMNEACRNMMHITDEDSVGKYNILQDPKLESMGLLPVVKKVFSQGEKVYFTVELQSVHPKPGDYETGTRILETTISPVLDSRKQLTHAVVQSIDVTERRQFEAALRRRQELGDLIAVTSSRFLRLDPAEINAGICNSLREIGEFMEADRSYLFFLKDGKSKADMAHEWCAEGIPSDLPTFQDLSIQEYALFSEPLLRSEIIHIPRMADMPLFAEWGKLGQALMMIQSLLLVPIEVGSTVIGCLGFDAVRKPKTWPSDTIGLLRILGEVYASALHRKQAEETQRNSERFLSQVIDNAPFGAYFYRLEDNDCLVLAKTNKAADRIIGIDHSKLIGMTVEQAFPGLANTTIPSTYKKIARDGTDYIQDEVDYDEGGIRGAYEINAFPTGPGSMAVFFIDITVRKQTEATLVEEATRRRLMFEHSPDGIITIDPKTTRFMEFNTAAHQQLGYTRDEFSKLTIMDVEAVESPEQTRKRVAEVLGGKQWDFETMHRTKTGETRYVHVRAHTLNILGESVYQCIWRDITDRKGAEEERKRLEAQLAQAQKMESVGRLAGGVAHDFNNMLGVIIGHSEMALDQFAHEEALRADLEEIRKAAQRSADLTRQLLAFARKQAVIPKVLNLNDSISGMLKMLRRLIGEDIDLEWMPQPDLHAVKIDPAQLDQILANLCVNARDAITGVGRITIRTQNATIRKEDGSEIIPGNYVALILGDNGCGMTKEVLNHLFEPFFTTKSVGRGTGLGLATVYGIVKQNDGFISVKSKPGKGTVFSIFLPPAAPELHEKMASGTKTTWQSQGQTVLIVEDEPAILGLGKTMLQRMGFTVLDAGGPGEALRKAEECGCKIDLLITDVIMPEMNGRDLAEKICSLYPDSKCLFMSGYTADVIAHRGVLEEGVHFIQKPFSFQDLSVKVRELLESSLGSVRE